MNRETAHKSRNHNQVARQHVSEKSATRSTAYLEADYEKHSTETLELVFGHVPREHTGFIQIFYRCLIGWPHNAVRFEY